MCIKLPEYVKIGENIIKESAELFGKMGQKCVIVTGRSSAKKSGALEDVASALRSNGIDFFVYDKIGENPLIGVCYEGGREAAKYGADFVVGIGGGSPMDAAKAVAAYASNPEIDIMELFETDKLKPSLPIVEIPLTAGTGSEVNPYAVMTLPEAGKKKTFKSQYSYPKYAFLDPRYQRSLPPDYTISTALDAFCHCIESYLSPKADKTSSEAALEGAKIIWDTLTKHDFAEKNESNEDASGLTAEQRYGLLKAACLGGVAINVTGTGFPHPLGYNLTLHEDGIPHGKACAVFTGEFIRYNMKTEEGARRIKEFAGYLMTEPEEIAEIIPKLSGVNLKLTKEKIDRYVSLTADAGNYKNSQYVINRGEMTDIMTKLFN
ncbi:MAG: iron-containing alcohol dehydrogenase [Firmicutes bacterium]|nr:iron-containing alcohol dehydrogenase [Bacillota bacterium]